MSVVKIHTDDLQAIYDILGDVLTRKPGRPSASAAEDLRTRAAASRDLTGAILGLGPRVPAEITTEPQTGAEIAAARMDAGPPTVEEVVEAIAADITPATTSSESQPKPALEGDDSPAP